MRQHLGTLEAFGLVTKRKIVTRPSRPTYLYRLSREGLRAFPKRYDLLLGEVMEVLIERHGEGVVADIVGAAARRIAARVGERFRGSSPGRRWDLLMDWLEQELAWQAAVSDGPAGRRSIVIHHCPFHDVSRTHPAVCGMFFTTLIQALYGDVPVEHVPATTGPACCSLLITGR